MSKTKKVATKKNKVLEGFIKFKNKHTKLTYFGLAVIAICIVVFLILILGKIFSGDKIVYSYTSSYNKASSYNINDENITPYVTADSSYSEEFTIEIPEFGSNFGVNDEMKSINKSIEEIKDKFNTFMSSKKNGDTIRIQTFPFLPTVYYTQSIVSIVTTIDGKTTYDLYPLAYNITEQSEYNTSVTMNNVINNFEYKTEIQKFLTENCEIDGSKILTITPVAMYIGGNNEFYYLYFKIVMQDKTQYIVGYDSEERSSSTNNADYATNEVVASEIENASQDEADLTQFYELYNKDSAMLPYMTSGILDKSGNNAKLYCFTAKK